MSYAVHCLKNITLLSTSLICDAHFSMSRPMKMLKMLMSHLSILTESFRMDSSLKEKKRPVVWEGINFFAMPGDFQWNPYKQECRV